MTVLSRHYSETGVIDADVFASFTEHSHSSCLLLLNGLRVSGVWYIDSMGSLCSGYGPSVMMGNVGSPINLLLSASNTEAIGVILGVLAFGWIPVVAPHHQKPSWAILASGAMFEAELLTEAGIEPLSTISSNLSIFLVPSICPFTFQLPALDNLGPKDMDDLSAAYGPVVVEWACTMLIAHQQGSMALDLYNHLESQDLLTRYLGSRASDMSPYVNKQGPCLSAVFCMSSFHSEDYQTLLSRLGRAAVTVAISPPAPVQQYVIQSSNEKKEINNMATGYNTLITIMICADYDPNSDVLSALKFPKPTEAFKRVSELTTKDECVPALKNMIDTNNSMRAPGSEHNMLVMM
jgi:hypothetical protein